MTLQNGHGDVVPGERATPDAHGQARRRVSVLGATGSVGENTLDLVRRAPDRFDVVALTANSNAERLAELAVTCGAQIAAVADPAAYGALKSALAGTGIRTLAGDEGVREAANAACDWTMAAIVGIAGLAPTLAAMGEGRTVALANKECLVSAGSVFTDAVRTSGTTLIPVDSEHSAVFQSLDQSGAETIDRITLTASGGPFRTWPVEKIAAARPEDALKHPNWSMGAKVTIDSASLMNKGLELIEAWHLFPVTPAQLDVLVHPQSAVHCLVTYRDGSMLAQLGAADMRTPIAYSLAWPSRMETPVARLDLVALGALTFESPDVVKFPCLRLAREAMDAGEAHCTVLNAANEIAVQAFLDGRLSFNGIAAIVEATLEQSEKEAVTGTMSAVDDVFGLDDTARTLAGRLLNDGQGTI